MARSYVFASVGGYYGSKQSGLAGVFCCATDNTNWKHALSEIEAFTVFAHPHDPNLVFAGTADGVYRSTDRGQNFHRAGFPDRGVQVWSFLHDDADPKCMLAGGSPVSIYRSEDGGASWKRLPDPHLPVHAKMPFSCRVMRFARHPGRSTEIFAVLEVSGVMHSTDGGESWSDRSADLLRLAEAEPRLRSKLVSDTEAEGMLDGHAVCTSSADPDSIIIAVRMGLFRSNDQGKSWQDMRVDRFSPFTYGRDIKVSPQDPNTLYACLSVAASSKDGALYRSQDVGTTWQRFDKVTPHGTLMSVGLHHADAKQVYVAARYGEVFGATTRAMIYSAICALRYPSLPVFPTPLPECQFDSLQNDVMDFAALLESRLPQGVVHGLGQVNACMDDAWARNGATSLAGCVGRQWRGSTALCHFATVRPS